MPSKRMLDIKICGINSSSAMDAALAAGADWVGLVFFPPSPRAVQPAQAKPLAAQARGKAGVVALLVDADDALITDVVEQVKPDALQLHGSEPPARLVELRQRFGLPLFKAIPVAAAADLSAAVAYRTSADHLLFDARPPKDATRPGGHGRSFDWTLLAAVDRSKPVMLSGGLTPENVATAIRIVRPDAVDVSSGVERSPGVKDPDKIRAFVRAARAAAAAEPATEQAS